MKRILLATGFLLTTSCNQPGARQKTGWFFQCPAFGGVEAIDFAGPGEIEEPWFDNGEWVWMEPAGELLLARHTNRACTRTEVLK